MLVDNQLFFLGASFFDLDDGGLRSELATLFLAKESLVIAFGTSSFSDCSS